MKRVFLMVCSICLVLAALFGLFTGAAGISDARNLQDYKTKDSELGLEAVDILLGGIEQLRANEGTYVEGVSTYEAGLLDYSAGKSTLSAGYTAYYEGKRTLEAGKAEYAAGKKQIEENTAAYNEGKAMLAKIEPLMPYLNQYVEFRDGTVANLPGFSNAQVWFVTVVRPIAANMGLDIPADVNDFAKYMQDMVAAGKAQLKEYEDGVAKLAEAEKTIAAGEAQLAEAEKQLAQGERDLAAGGQALADGKAALSEFENGAAQIAAGLELLLAEEENSTGTYYFSEGTSGEVACPSIKAILQERYGSDWTFWMTDENGEIVVRNGCQYLDLDACEQAAIAAQDYISAYQGDPGITGGTFKRIFYCIAHPDGEITYNNLGHDVTLPCSQCETVIGEVISRYLVSVLEIVASIMALISGIFGIIYCSRRRGVSGMVCGWVTSGIGLAGTIFGFCTSFTSYIYPIALYSGDERTGYEYSSHAQAPALIVLTMISIAFAVMALLTLKSDRQHIAAEDSAEDEDFDIPDPSEEKETLRQMAADIASEETVKE